MVKVGEKVPQMSLRDQDGKDVKLSDFKGKILVLYFYPKDDTPGCTKEACSFRDSYQDIKSKDIEVVGVSFDNEESHKKFIKKYNLPFTLLIDSERGLAKKLDVYGKKSFMGRSFFGVKRMTFLIDKDGVIRHIFNNVKPEGHSQEVLEKIKELGI